MGSSDLGLASSEAVVTFSPVCQLGTRAIHFKGRLSISGYGDTGSGGIAEMPPARTKLSSRLGRENPNTLAA